ncbi:MAG: HD domain-containing protein [Planctomycetales bacterium]|nr:HD domain-containing protein [Planctomycetales bacterium]
MSRQFISQLGDRDEVNEVYIASEKQLRPNRNGDLYLQLRLTDKTGVVNAMMWNAKESVYNSFENGDFVDVTGKSQVYNGNMQVILSHIDRAKPGSVDDSAFSHIGADQLEDMSRQVAAMIRAMDDFHLKNLGECFLMDDEFQRKFTSAPAGIKNHHAYPGGLLQHVLGLMQLAAKVACHYPALNRDILIMGAFLHDIGKIDELTYDRALGYSDSGQLVGHLVQGVSILDKKIEEAEQLANERFPEDLAIQLRHLIVSHHGKMEFGSPKVPMTLEAVALHYLDDMDAKLFTFEQLMREDVNTDSNWTVYHPALGRKLFKTV